MVLSTQSPPRQDQQNAPLPGKAAAVTPAPRHRPRSQRGHEERLPTWRPPNKRAAGAGGAPPAGGRRYPAAWSWRLRAHRAASPSPTGRRPFPSSGAAKEPGRLFVLCEGRERAPLLRRRRKTAPSARGSRPGAPGGGGGKRSVPPCITTPAQAAPLAQACAGSTGEARLLPTDTASR